MLMRCVVMMSVAIVASGTAAAASQERKAPVCKASGALARIAALPEGSGLVASASGRLWAHNDSGKAELIALDRSGRTTVRVAVEGANVVDWEALASAPCGNGSCLYVGDIGDNDATRRQITIYRVPEPAPSAATARVTGVFHATYPDGAHDAETLLASPDGTLYVVTKGDTGRIALYRFPRELRTGATVKLERVGELTAKQPADDQRITDGAMSADGQWVALRTRTTLTFYRAADFLKGSFAEAGRMDLRSLGEPQGEAVAFGPSNTVYLGGEGGGKSQPGTLLAMTCAS